MKHKIDTQEIKIGNKTFGIIIISFGKSLYVWVGDNSLKTESLMVSLPFNIRSNVSDRIVTTSLLNENELCSSLSTYMCKTFNLPISLSLNVESSELNTQHMNKLQLLINNRVADILKS